jgi:cytochrome c oxidase accessory protein FixG
MPIDLSDRIIQPLPKKALKLHPLRRLLQVALGVVTVLLPITNCLRVDIPDGNFWLFGQSFTAQNMILVFYGLAICALLLLSVSMVYGRWWCGWICPQTLASDFGDTLKARLLRWFHASQSKSGKVAAQIVWSSLMIVMAIATAAVVLTYFYPPARVWRAVAQPFDDTRISIHLLIVAAIIGADLLWVRRHFCRRGCPYGLMLSLIGDKNTMTVRYLWERDDDCIQCGQCVTVCPMDIDIKEGANQMECIGCGECIDACNDILPLVKSNPKPGLIELRYGLDPMRLTSRLSLTQRIGLWDARRIFVCLVAVVLTAVFFYEMFGHRRVALAIVPSGSISLAAGYVIESYELNIANGEPSNTNFSLSASGVEHLFLYRTRPVVNIARSSERTVFVTVAAPSGKLTPDRRYPISILVRSLDDNKDWHAITTIFYVPELPAQLKAG